MRHVGERAAYLLSNNFSSIKELKSASKEKIESIHEIGPKVSESIVYFFAEKKNVQVMDKLKKLGVNMESRQKNKQRDLLHGKQFALRADIATGTGSGNNGKQHVCTCTCTCSGAPMHARRARETMGNNGIQLF